MVDRAMELVTAFWERRSEHHPDEETRHASEVQYLAEHELAELLTTLKPRRVLQEQAA